MRLNSRAPSTLRRVPFPSFVSDRYLLVISAISGVDREGSTQVARELKFAMKVEGFEDPILGRVSFEQFDDPILGLEKLGMFEDPFFCEVAFEGRKDGLKISTGPLKGVHFDPSIP